MSTEEAGEWITTKTIKLSVLGRHLDKYCLYLKVSYNKTNYFRLLEVENLFTKR